jgi:hypothetical protein
MRCKEIGRFMTPSDSRAKAMNIVNQLGDLWGVPVNLRQFTNDPADVFVRSVIEKAVTEARIDELKLLQASEDIPDDVKDVCYYPHIKDRLAALKQKKGDV